MKETVKSGKHFCVNPAYFGTATIIAEKFTSVYIALQQVGYNKSLLKGH